MTRKDIPKASSDARKPACRCRPSSRAEIFRIGVHRARRAAVAPWLYLGPSTPELEIWAT